MILGLRFTLPLLNVVSAEPAAAPPSISKQTLSFATPQCNPEHSGLTQPRVLRKGKAAGMQGSHSPHAILTTHERPPGLQSAR